MALFTQMGHFPIVVMACNYQPNSSQLMIQKPELWMTNLVQYMSFVPLWPYDALNFPLWS